MPDSVSEPKKCRIDWFSADVLNVEITLTDEAMAALVGTAIQYLKANPGGMPWEKWSLLSEVSRTAFTAAADHLKTRELLDVPK